MLHPPTTNKLLHHSFFQPKNSRMSLQLYKLPSYPDSFKKMQSTYKKNSNVIGEVTFRSQQRARDSWFTEVFCGFHSFPGTNKKAPRFNCLTLKDIFSSVLSLQIKLFETCIMALYHSDLE